MQCFVLCTVGCFNPVGLLQRRTEDDKKVSPFLWTRVPSIISDVISYIISWGKGV